METVTEKGTHTSEHGLKKIGSPVVTGDCVLLLHNTSTKAYQCNDWNILMSTRHKESLTCFLTDLIDIEPISNHADKLLF